jgi:hypothetical protein
LPLYIVFLIPINVFISGEISPEFDNPSLSFVKRQKYLHYTNYCRHKIEVVYWLGAKFRSHTVAGGARYSRF